MAKLVTGKFPGAHEDIVIRRDKPVEMVRQQLTNANGTPKFKKWGDERVIYSSPLVDVAANMDLVRETIEIVKAILELTNWQVRLLSKSNLLPKIAIGLEAAGVTDARNRVIYGVSTGTLDDRLAAAMEIDCPKVSKRIESLHWLQDNGFRTFGMICPSLPQLDYLKFANAMADAIRMNRCEHVWAEVINLRGASFTKTIAALKSAGFNVEAKVLELVSTDDEAWECYARRTFEAHAAFIPTDKLRFLQYVNKCNIAYWRGKRGAVLLGKLK